MVVDDDVAICEMFSKFLERDGYTVTVAHDGRSALDRLRTEAVDLLILDINMPELGGASLVQILRRDPEWARFVSLPIIVVSALWDVVTFDLDVQAGFGKPVKYEELRDKTGHLTAPPDRPACPRGRGGPPPGRPLGRAGRKGAFPLHGDPYNGPDGDVRPGGGSRPSERRGRPPASPHRGFSG